MLFELAYVNPTANVGFVSHETGEKMRAVNILLPHSTVMSQSGKMHMRQKEVVLWEAEEHSARAS